MPHVITAVYENGVLRPITPLRLKEHQKVKVQIVPDSPMETVDHVLQLLSSAGRVTPPRKQSAQSQTSDGERLKLARFLGKSADKSLSDFILEERDAR
ncbi:MAG: antitoxin family protein [Deltaproteobacteria bacterium]|nr:antitoxin family protein [Deltaproteobacteria bacterium]